jgi:hypothetical protein
MPHYVGLDVSQKTTSICVVDEQGHRLWRGVCDTHPDPIAHPTDRAIGRLGFHKPEHDNACGAQSVYPNKRPRALGNAS